MEKSNAQYFKEWTGANCPKYKPYDAPGKRVNLICGDCGDYMDLVNLKTGGLIYRCRMRPACKSAHSSHPWGSPFGIPANKVTRRARFTAHRAFDRIWKRNHMKRAKAYEWLASELAFPEAHIGEMDETDCAKVVSVCDSFIDKRKAEK